MARATRSADLKRKRSESAPAPNKQQRTDPPTPVLDARPVLAVLEAADTQGLLDRVFAVPNDPAAQVSLRALLAAPAPLDALTAAIAHLRPIAAAPRAAPSPTAAQQTRFCDLALALLAQLPPASDFLSHTSALPDTPDSPPPRPRLTYALVQHLPNGDWWTSAASASLGALPTAHAELVAILPAPAVPDSPIPTLGSYSRPLPARKPLPTARRLTTGAFLDYGPYTSFAPAFDQDCELVGRQELGQVLLHRAERRRLRSTSASGAVRRADAIPLPSSSSSAPSQEEEADAGVPEEDLAELLPPEQVAALKEALGSLALEKAVQKLLERNQRALVRLGELQRLRMAAHPAAVPEEGSEEWDTGV